MPFFCREMASSLAARLAHAQLSYGALLELCSLTCTLDAHESASGELSVNVEGRHVGYVASCDAALIVSGEARIVSVDRFGENWRLRALPRP